MAKRKRDAGQINKRTLSAIRNLMKDLDQKYSIKVGIIGNNAYEQHPHTDLTNAQLGAIHEFGAVINVTPKMRAYLHYNGIHLKKDTTQVIIPARSFLRDTLLSKGGKEELLERVMLTNERDFNKALVEVRQADNPDIDVFKTLCEQIGLEALVMVQDAFAVGGRPDKWKPISEVTRQNRKNDKSSPPLTDSGDLRNSITMQVKKVK